MTIFNIPIKFHWTFFLLLACMINPFDFSSFQTNLYIIAIFFPSLFLHELSHCLVARYLGYPVFSMTFFGLGAVATIDFKDLNSTHEFLIAIAGPAVNFILFLFGFCLYLGLVNYQFINIDNIYFSIPWMMNLVFGVFNMLPVYPMDGGRVLKSLLSKIFGEVIALLWVRRLSLVMAVAMIFFGAYQFLPMLVLVGFFILITV